MPQMITEPTFTGYISSTHDALIIFECVRRGIMPKVNRRLRDDERRLIRSGSVFVFDEKESGIRRWTDGLLWSPSRILWNFLVYRQIEKKAGKGGATGSSSSLEASTTPVSSSSQLQFPSSDFAFDPLAQGVGAYPPHFSNHSQPGSALDSPNSPYLQELTLPGSGEAAVRSSASAHSQSRMRSVSSASDSAAANHRMKPYPLCDPRVGINGQSQLGTSLQSSSVGDDTSPISRGPPRSASSVANREAEIERALVGSLKSSYPFAKDGLCKKTISIQVHGSTQHLISYYRVEDVRSGRLRTPLSLPEISGLDISPMILQKSNFRNPPDIEVLPDGTLRYRGDGSESSRRNGGGGSGSEGTSGSDGVNIPPFATQSTHISPSRLSDVYSHPDPFEGRLQNADGGARVSDARRPSDDVYGQIPGAVGPAKTVRSLDGRGDPYSASAVSYDHAGGNSTLDHVHQMQGQQTYETSTVGAAAAHEQSGVLDVGSSLSSAYWQNSTGSIPSGGRYPVSPRLTLDTGVAGGLGSSKLQRLNSGRSVTGPSSAQSALGFQPQGTVYLQQSSTWVPKTDVSTTSWTPSGGVCVPEDASTSEAFGHSIRSDGGMWHQIQPSHSQMQTRDGAFGISPPDGVHTQLDGNSETRGQLSFTSQGPGQFVQNPYQQGYSISSTQHPHLHHHQELQSHSPLVQAMQQQVLSDPNGGGSASASSYHATSSRRATLSGPEDAAGRSQSNSWQPESMLSQQMHHHHHHHHQRQLQQHMHPNRQQQQQQQQQQASHHWDSNGTAADSHSMSEMTAVRGGAGAGGGSSGSGDDYSAFAFQQSSGLGTGQHEQQLQQQRQQQQQQQYR